MAKRKRAFKAKNAAAVETTNETASGASESETASGEKREYTFRRLVEEAIREPGPTLDAYLSMHEYSLHNVLLAAAQCSIRGVPLGPLGTFKGWRARGRYVKKGEKALMLCMPIVRRERDEATGEERVSTFFQYRNYWFTIHQTSGEDYLRPEHPEFQAARALRELNVEEAPFQSLDPNILGYASGRKIAIHPEAPVSQRIWFHELAHVVLGHTEEATLIVDGRRLETSLMEVEADTVAYLCLTLLQLPGAEYCRRYIQKWLAGQALPESSARRIILAANQILRAGQPQITDAVVDAQ
jgi:N-terminal domain of anti-restriction factor ArdC